MGRWRESLTLLVTARTPTKTTLCEFFLFYDERQPCRTVTQRSVEVKPGKCSGPQKEMFETRPLVFFKSAHFYNPTQTSLKSTILFPDLCDNESYLQFKLLKKKVFILSGRNFRIWHISPSKLLNLCCCHLLRGRRTGYY